jgi:nucleotide-binding universal stress UspA family protein
MSTVATSKPVKAKGESCVNCLESLPRPEQPPQIHNVLVAVDFSEYSAAALRYGMFLAESFSANLILAHAAEPYICAEDLAAGLTVSAVDARCIEIQTAKLESLRQTVKTSVSAVSVVTKGTPWSQIVAMAKTSNADLIILGTHGRTGLKHALMGSTAERVVRHAACPVLVVHLPVGGTN